MTTRLNNVLIAGAELRHLLILIYCFHRKHISRGSDVDLACAHADREELDRVVTQIQRDAAEPVRAERVDLVEKSLGVRVPSSALKWL
jgi:hypothetical protein